MTTLTEQNFQINTHELWLLQSDLSDRIIAHHRTAANPMVSKKMSEDFAALRDERFALFQKLGGLNSLEDLIRIGDEARENVNRFEASLKD